MNDAGRFIQKILEPCKGFPRRQTLRAQGKAHKVEEHDAHILNRWFLDQNVGIGQNLLQLIGGNHFRERCLQCLVFTVAVHHFPGERGKAHEHKAKIRPKPEDFDVSHGKERKA